MREIWSPVVALLEAALVAGCLAIGLIGRYPMLVGALDASGTLCLVAVLLMPPDPEPN